MKFLADSLQRKVIFLTGKGGVGKSTLAWAMARALNRQGKRTAVIGWQSNGKTTPPEFAGMGVEWIGLDTLEVFKQYALTIIKFEKLYDTVLDNKVLRTFVLAAPGLSDSVMAGRIWDLAENGPYDTLVVDMPSSGHARAFFKSPLGLKKIFKMGFIARDTERVLNLFAADTTRIDLVCLPEQLPVQECRELKADLEKMHPFHFGYTYVNQCVPEWAVLAAPELAKLDAPGKELARRFIEKANAQSETLGTSVVGLPEIRLARLAHPGWRETVEALADLLEKQ